MKVMIRAIPLLLATMSVLAGTAGLSAGEPTLETGGFVAVQKQDTWIAGAPACLGEAFAPTEVKAQDPNHLVFTLKSLALPWTFDGKDGKITLESKVTAGSFELDVQGMGLLAGTPTLDLLRNQSTAQGMVASFLSGKVIDSLPGGNKDRIVGLSVASASGLKADIGENEKHPLKDAEEISVRYVAIEYLPASDTASITTVENLRTRVRSLVFLGVSNNFAGGKTTVLECCWNGNAPGEYAQAQTTPLTGDVAELLGLTNNVVTSGLTPQQGGSMQKINISPEAINNLFPLPLGLTSDIVGVIVAAPDGGQMMLADLPGFSLPVPGLPENLRFSPSRMSLALGGREGVGFSIDAGLENPGILLGPLGAGIRGPKNVSLTVQGKKVIVNFRNALEDLKPLGFSLLDPTIAIDFDRRGIELRGSLLFPDNLPIPLKGAVDVTCELSQANLQFLVISSVEMPFFDDRIRLSLNTLSVGMTDGVVSFMSVGKARFTQDISMMQGIDAFKKLGLDLKVGGEVTCTVFAQSDGKIHVELLTEDLIKLQVGPVNSSLDEVRFVLDAEPGSPVVASVAGQASLDIEQGIFKLHATTRAELSTEGSLKIEIPDDPENPTHVAIGDLDVILKHGEFLVAKDDTGQVAVSLDATVKTTFPKEIPMIGGQDLVGRMMAKSDGTFLFELSEIPQLVFADMKVGLQTVRIENKKDKATNTFMLSFEAGAGVEFMPSFPLEPLRNEKVKGSVKVSSDLTVMFTLSGAIIKIGDFRFGIEEMSVGLAKGRDVLVSGTALLQVKYPSSKYFGIGLPAALAGNPTGPDFDIRGTLTVSATNVYFQARSDSTEIPIDIPGVLEGVTIRVDQIGVGITYAGIPLFDLKGSLYLPDLEGKGATGTTPTLKRAYDSRLGLVLAGNVQDGIVAALQIEGNPKIAIKPVFEFSLQEAGVSTWLYGYALSADLTTRLKIGQPERGFGTLFDLQKGHFTVITGPFGPPIPIPFYDKCRIEANVGGFGMGLESEFPRPQLVDIGVILDVIQTIQKGKGETIFVECGRGGKFNKLFPRFAVNEASLMMPAEVAKKLNAPSKINLLASVGGKIDLNSGDIVPLLPRMVDAVRRPADTLAGIVAAIPPERREGTFDSRIGVGSFNLISGKLHYRLQAREPIYEKRTVPLLGEVLSTVDLINAVEAQPGPTEHQQWLLLDQAGGYVSLQNRKSGTCLVASSEGKPAEGGALQLAELKDGAQEFLWCDSKSAGRTRSFANRVSNRLLSTNDDLLCLGDESFGDKSRWSMRPVFGTRYVMFQNQAAGKVMAAKGKDGLVLENRVLTGNVSVTVPSNPTVSAVSLNAESIKIPAEVNAVLGLLGSLRMPANATCAQFLAKVQQVAPKAAPVVDGGFAFDLTPSTSVRVSPYGHVSANIGRGACELRTSVENPPDSGVIGLLQSLELDTPAGMGGYPYSGIKTQRDVAMGNPDCHAARTWKTLWNLRDPGKAPTVTGTLIRLPLKSGAEATFDVSVACRIVRQAPAYQFRLWTGQIVTGPILTIWDWKRADSLNAVALKSGQIVASTGGFGTPFELFDPARTSATGEAGLLSTTLAVNKVGIAPTGGIEDSQQDPLFKFTLTDSLGWKAELENGRTLKLTPPGKQVQVLPLLAGVGKTLEQILTGAAAGAYPPAGQLAWSLSRPDGSVENGTAKSADEVVAAVGTEIEACKLSWTANGVAASAAVNGAGALTVARPETKNARALNLRPAGGSQSSVEVASAGITHEIRIGRTPVAQPLTQESLKNSGTSVLPPKHPFGPYQTSVFLSHNGGLSQVEILDPVNGVVRDPAFRDIPMGLDLDGSMQIGDKTLVQTALAFAGHIDEAGGIALAANGNVTVQGFQLGSTEFSFRSFPGGKDNGLTFSGTMQAPFQGKLSGEIHENGNFNVSGNVQLLVSPPGAPKTGFVGNLVMDRNAAWMHGNIIVADRVVFYTSTRIVQDNSGIRYNTSSGVSIGLGGYHTKVLWWWVWVPYSGVKGGLDAEIVFKYRNPTSLTASLNAYVEAIVLDKSWGRANLGFQIPNLCEVRTSSLFGRNLETRFLPLYLRWDAPDPLSDPQIGWR